MDSSISSNQAIAELIGMGFEFSNVTEAVEVVGPSVEAAVEYILNGSRRNSNNLASSCTLSTSIDQSQAKIASSSFKSSGRMKQSTIREHLQFTDRTKRKKTSSDTETGVTSLKLANPAKDSKDLYHLGNAVENAPEAVTLPYDIGTAWEKKAVSILQKHFGYSSLKSFQKEALTAWSAHQDCLVLAATGSGKSLCFQIPALLTGKVVVVISPLISLMHDQCLKLVKHGVSACFLGSGQTDRSIECKAMRGMYSIVYVCPETVHRLLTPLQSLAESRGIALFAIDEVHCISKWGHDFRPHYRQLSILREIFSAKNLKFLSYDIPLMALTATATTHVREDILNSLCMSTESKTVLTSFFRPNLRFSVKHSKTKSQSSYRKDFLELINIYTSSRSDSISGSMFETDGMSEDEREDIEDGPFAQTDDDVSSETADGKRMSVEYLEDESDLFQGVDDFDVSCGEFFGQSSDRGSEIHGSSEIYGPSKMSEGGGMELEQGRIEEGLTIIYVPTRKETVSISKFLLKFGVKAASYHAKLPKSHLREVHKKFHANALEVVVATIAFGMGIDKLNVRRIIHYGWPQSLEAYYQEAGRAGRDGKLADCILYASLLGTPSLLPSKRSEEQTRQAYKMLADCFRYGMNSSTCRAKILVEYFGEQFCFEKCHLCDICRNGAPERLNVKAEAGTLMQAISSHYGQASLAGSPYDQAISQSFKQFMEKPSIRTFVRNIREKSQNFVDDIRWWRGLSRILEEKGLIREGDGKVHVQIQYPEPTELGLQFLLEERDEDFYVYPEADMILCVKMERPYSSFSEWGKGWADPEIRRQRLQRKRGKRRDRSKRRVRKRDSDLKTVRGRLAVKLSKQKR